MIRRGLPKVAPTILPSLEKELFPLLGVAAGTSLGDARFSSSLAAPSSKHRGTGGRSSVSGVVATVFGATGFLGRYVVQQLAKMGSQVMVPFRGLEDEHKHLKLMGDLGQIVPMKFNVRDEESIMAPILRSNVVINLIGREYETHNFSFGEINVGVAERISRLASQHSEVYRFIQVSCLGASPSARSRQHRTKAAGEEAVLKNFPEATVLRPAALVGTEDRLLNRFAMFAKKMPVVPIIGDGKTQLQPVHVTDVAAAVVAIVKDDGSSMGKTYELGGSDVFTINDLVHLTFETIREPPRVLHIPYSLAKVIAGPEALFKRLSFPTPKMITFSRDNIESLKQDYIVSSDALTFQDLNITPRKLYGVAIEHLYAFRSGGPNMGSTRGEQSGVRF